MSRPLWAYADFSENHSRGLGSPNKFFCICRHTDFLRKCRSVATKAMLAVNEVAESIVYKKRTVSIHRLCLLSAELEKRMKNFFKKASQSAHTIEDGI